MNTANSDFSVLERLARTVHSIHYEDLPTEVVGAVKDLALDTLGCAYGGFHSDVGTAVLRMASACGGASQSTLIGTGEKTSAPLATLVNGTLMRYLDSNDYYFSRDPAHPSGSLAVALAVGERQRCSGKDLIAGLVAAYEIHLRLCDFAGEPSLWKRGWHHATNAQFANAALASRLTADDPTCTAHAMAIVGSHQNTLAQLQSGAISMIKATAEAWVAKAGVEAALLAAYGVTGPLLLMEGTNGWASSVAGKVDFDQLTSPVSTHYRLLDVCIKPYPAVATAMALIHAAIELYREGPILATDIKKIVVRLSAFALNSPSAHPKRRYAPSVESAQHSFYYCTAVALLDGACGSDQFEPDHLNSAPLRELLDKIELVQDDEFTRLWPQAAGGAVELHMHNGALRSRRCPFPPGHPRLAMSRHDIANKFYSHADPVLSHRDAQALHDVIYGLEDCSDLTDLTKLLAPREPRPM